GGGLRLVNEGDPMAALDQLLGQGLQHTVVTGQRRCDHRKMAHGGGSRGTPSRVMGARRKASRSALPVQKQAIRSCWITTSKCSTTAAVESMALGNTAAACPTRLAPSRMALATSTPSRIPPEAISGVSGSAS